MRMNRRHKRDKVQKRYLERRLYKTERRIEKLNGEALLLRQSIKIMDEQAMKQRKEREEAVNRSLHDAAIESVPGKKEGEKHASN